MKSFIPFVVGVVLAVAVALAFGAYSDRVSFAVVATVLVGLCCLVWLVVIVVLPWNTFFQARHLLNEIAKSRERGVAVPEVQEHKAQAVARRMLRISIGLHLGSALVVGVGSFIYGERVGYVFAGLFLLSTLFRPAVEYHRYLRQLLSDALVEIRYPRDDVLQLVAEVKGLVQTVEQHREELRELSKEDSALRRDMETRTDEARRKLDGVARRFDETIDRLTDNQEIISGIKAFLRLVQRPGPLPPG